MSGGLNLKGCPQLGSRKQHQYIQALARKAGYHFLTRAVADALKIDPVTITPDSRIGRDQAGKVIDYLKDKVKSLK